jgi:acetate---CoA ligase (ADP-forming)
VLPQVLAPDEDAAVRAAEELGYPVALKLSSRTLVHKSEWAGVKLNLLDEAAVRAACKDIRGKLEEAGREADLEGFLVQPMVPSGVELMVGMSDDPLFGPILAFGLGGIHVEVLQDVVFRITPLTERDADEMVTGIRGYRLLQGYRGAPEADVAAVKALLLRVSRLAQEVPEIEELDLNPIKAHEPGRGYSVLDARIRVGGESREGEAESRGEKNL